jgi:DNA-binding IclR family transcriptional regulator
MNVNEKSISSTIKSVDKALEVLEAFSEISGGIKLSCLSEKLNMNKSGVYRLLQVFKQRGYVEQKCKNGKYHLGMAAYMVGQNIVSNMELMHTTRPIMEKLVREHNETVYLALPSDKKVLLFDSINSLHAVNVMSLKGLQYPLSGCAAGDMLLAFGMTPVEGDLSTPSQNDEYLDMLKQKGYSTDVHRLGEGVVSLAVPLMNAEKLAVGSLCFVGPESRFTDERIKNRLRLPLINAGHTISAKLGYFGYHLT